MRNSIFKSYTKKILRSEAFISVIIVFVLAIGMIGTSYALYMDVDTDEDNYQLVEVGDLKISFQDGSNKVTLDQMTPISDDQVINGSEVTTYSFSIHNVGTYDASYDVKLETTESNTVSKEYIKYIICKEVCEGITNSDIKKLSDLTDSKVYSGSIKTGSETGDTYIIKVWLDSAYQATANQTMQLKVVVDAKNKSVNSNNIIATTLLNSAQTAAVNGDTTRTIYVESNDLPTTPGTQPSGANEKIYTYNETTKTHYYRGNVIDNYVNFNNMCWRIVSVNPDGSTKLVLSAQKICEQITDVDTTTAFIGSGDYGYAYGKNTFDYSSTESSTYTVYSNDYFGMKDYYDVELDGTFVTFNGGGMRSALIEWFKANFSDEKRLSFLAVTLKEKDIRETDDVYFEDYVAPLSKEEVLFSGLANSSSANSYLIANSNDNWWTKTIEKTMYRAGYIDCSYPEYGIEYCSEETYYDYVYIISSNNKIESLDVADDANYRPSITLLPTVEINGGTGLKTDPYIID